MIEGSARIGNGGETAHSPNQIVQNVAASVPNDAVRGSTTLLSHVQASGRNSSHVRIAHPRLHPLRRRSRIGDPWPSLPPHRHRVARHRIRESGADRISARILPMRGRRRTLHSPITHRRRRRSGQLAANLSPPPLTGRIVDPRLGGSSTMGGLGSPRGDIVVEIVAMGALHLIHLPSPMTTRTGGLVPGRFFLLAGL